MARCKNLLSWRLLAVPCEWRNWKRKKTQATFVVFQKVRTPREVSRYSLGSFSIVCRESLGSLSQKVLGIFNSEQVIELPAYNHLFCLYLKLSIWMSFSQFCKFFLVLLANSTVHSRIKWIRSIQMVIAFKFYPHYSLYSARRIVYDHRTRMATLAKVRGSDQDNRLM